ncbi:hypothetical protein LZ575_13615 [Antarcticibacterium sp. 1MA-6-2]|uniref:hypothetical protein n=1 Tax=Antarcticibacterium sp. 1MA-6-2 TaxID=2908210 RepID=UPI001F38ACAE|nr:hypothetical protein [Antarcticibacterium sp. 1MA-6-2]UJH89986.1 hypothetical protein LZ575_13615 [Antarcticibacterium sp. 1MA-6-2]
MMKITTKISSIAKLYCTFFGHNLTVSKNVTNHIHEYKCAHCGVEMTDTADGFLARLTPKFKETNDYISQIYVRRRQRRTQYANAS